MNIYSSQIVFNYIEIKTNFTRKLINYEITKN